LFLKRNGSITSITSSEELYSILSILQVILAFAKKRHPFISTTLGNNQKKEYLLWHLPCQWTIYLYFVFIDYKKMIP
jgi:hypothetical protein